MYRKPTPLQNGPPAVGWEIILNSFIRLAVSKAPSLVVFVVNIEMHRGRHFPPLTMCDHSALCNAASLCEHCFDEAGDSTANKRKKTGGRNRELSLSPTDQRLLNNKLKLGHSRRKRAKVKADNEMFLKLQHECARLKQEKDELLQKHGKEMAVLREAGARAIRMMEADYGKVSLLDSCIYIYVCYNIASLQGCMARPLTQATSKFSSQVFILNIPNTDTTTLANRIGVHGASPIETGRYMRMLGEFT